MQRRRSFLVLIVPLLFLSQQGLAQDPAEIPVTSFATLPSFGSVSLSPDGTHIAYRVTYEMKSLITMHSLAGKEDPVYIPPFQNAEIGWFDWANDDTLVVSFNFSGDRRSYNGQRLINGANTEETRFLAFTKDGKNVTKPVRLAKPERVSGSRSSGSEPINQDYVIDWLSDDPEHILLGLDADLDGATEIRKVNVTNGKFRTVRSGIRGVTGWLTDPSGKIRYGFGRQNGKNHGYYRAFDGESFDSVEERDWFKRGIQPVVFENSNSHVVYAVGKAHPDDDTNAVIKLDMLSGEILETVHREESQDTWVAFDQRERSFLGYSTLEKTVFLDDQRAMLQRSMDAAFKGYEVRLLTHSPDWRKLIIRVTSDVESGAIYLWNRDAGEMQFVGASYPNLQPELMSAKQEITYAARDGLDISGFLTIPRGAEPKDLPLVIMPHGGPFAAERKSFDFVTQMMASRGVAVLQPNFRGSILQGEAFHEAGKKQWGGKMQDDLTDGVRHLIAEGIADPERVCIVGWSYGGYAALMGAIATPELYQCAVSINGVTDLRRLARRYNLNKDYRAFIKEYVGLEGAELSEVSPRDNAQKVDVPVLLVHAEDDNRVPIEHADAMAEELKDNDKPFIYERIEFGGGHSLLNGQGRLRMMKALDAFLASRLGVGAGSDRTAQRPKGESARLADLDPTG